MPISYWLEIKDLIFFFKCKQGLYDLDISSFVTFSSNRSSRTRSSKDNLLQVNPCKTSLFRNSFFNRIVFLWNNLSPIIRNSSSVSSFKFQLHSHYSSQVDSSFDVNRMRTWKTYQWRAGYYFFWGASELSTNMRPYNVTLDKRGPKARAERRRCEVFLRGSGGMLPRKIFKFRVSAMPFPGLWGKI